MTGSVPTPNPAQIIEIYDVRKTPENVPERNQAARVSAALSSNEDGRVASCCTMAPKVKGAAKAAGKAKAVAKAASPEPPPKVAGPEKLSVFDAETNLNFVEDDDWAQLAEHPNDTSQKVLEAVLLLMGDPDTTWENAAAALQKPEVYKHLPEIFCFTDLSQIYIILYKTSLTIAQNF